VVFAYVVYFPWEKLIILPLPIPIPAPLYAVLYLAYTYYSARHASGRINHDAHLGGAIVGLLLSAMMYPGLILAAPWMFVGVISFSLVILMVLIFDPAHLLEHHLGLTSSSPGNGRAREYDENRGRNRKKAEIDRLLDKLAQKGMDKLSIAERKKLGELSKEVYGRK